MMYGNWLRLKVIMKRTACQLVRVEWKERGLVQWPEATTEVGCGTGSDEDAVPPPTVFFNFQVNM